MCVLWGQGDLGQHLFSIRYWLGRSWIGHRFRQNILISFNQEDDDNVFETYNLSWVKTEAQSLAHSRPSKQMNNTGTNSGVPQYSF